MTETITRAPKLPPRWFIRLFWRVHRLLYRLGGGRFLWDTTSRRGWGALSLTTVGRRTGQERTVILGYLEDGSDLVTLAMNGWGEGHPAWWLNLRADPTALVQIKGCEPITVRAHAAGGAERIRLWQRWAEVDQGLDEYAAGRHTPTPVVVLTPIAA